MAMVAAGNSNPVKCARIFCARFADELSGFPTQLRQKVERVSDIARLIDLAAMWYRRKKRRIGLNQHTIKRTGKRRFLHSRGILEGNNTRKRDIGTEREKVFHF